MATVHFSFEFGGKGPKRVRTATVFIPFDWDALENLGTSAITVLGVETVTGGAPVVVVLGGNVGEVFMRKFLLDPNQINRKSTNPFARWAHAIVIYPDPVTNEGDNEKFNSGIVGEGGWLDDVDDVGFILELLHRVRTMLMARIVQRRDAGEPRYVKGLRVINPDEIYMVGWSAGGAMCYRMAYEAPLVHPNDLDYEYRFAAMFVLAASVGGFRHSQQIGTAALRVDFSPALFPKLEGTVVRSYPSGAGDTFDGIRIFHMQGAQDKSIPGQLGEILKKGFIVDQYFLDDGTLKPTGVRRGGAAKVVLSPNSVNNYTNKKIGYPDTRGREEARADYIAEYGIERWLQYKGLVGLFTTNVLTGTPGKLTGTLAEVNPNTALWPAPTAADAAYLLQSNRFLIRYPVVGVAEVVYMLIADTGHGWPPETGAPKVELLMMNLILDFFDKKYP